MNDAVLSAVLLLAAYLVGSVPVGLLLSRHRGIDIRTVGSGNIGASNVARSLGKKLGSLVLALDAAKGALPVAVAMTLHENDGSIRAVLPHAAGFAAIVGHCFPPWLRFRGGKGVATALGVFVIIDPLVTGLAVAVFAALYAAFRITSVGSLAAAAAVAVLMAVLHRPGADLVLALVGAALIALRHQRNIARLARRSEYKV